MVKVVSIMEIGFISIKKYLLLYTSVQYHEEIRCYFVIAFLWSFCHKYFCSRSANRTSIE